MKKLFIILTLLLTFAVRVQCQQISYIEESKNWYYLYDEKGKKLKSMNVSDVGEIVGVAGSTITSRKGDWIFTWGKDGKKISARSVNN